jgi:hypothetical protein
MIKQFVRSMAGLAILAVSGAAVATTCSSLLSAYQSCVQGGSCSPYASPQNMIDLHPECFGGSGSTSETQISGTSFTQVSAISGALAGRLLNSSPSQIASNNVKGMAAGGKVPVWNVWGSVTDNDTRAKYQIANTVGTGIATNDSNIVTAVLGFDYALSPTMVVGLSGAFDRGDGSGQFSLANTGANTVSSHGYSIAPYLGAQLSKEFALDVSAGFGGGKMTMTGTNTSDSDRMFYAANLSYNQWLNNIQLTGKLGYLHGEEKYDDMKVSGATQASTGSKNRLDQLRLGVQAGYWMGNGVMPYAGLVYSSDVGRSSSLTSFNPIGKDAWIWSLGLNFFSLSSGVSGGIAYNQEEGRSNQKNNNWVANVSFRF